MGLDHDPGPMNPLLGILFVLVLVGANSFFVALEFALVAADRSKLELEAEAGSYAARVALRVAKRLSFHLSGAQFGITISSLVLGYLTEILVGERGSAVTTLIALGAATVFQMVLGELIPKNVAVALPEQTAKKLAPAAQVVHGALSPFIISVQRSGQRRGAGVWESNQPKSWTRCRRSKIWITSFVPPVPPGPWPPTL